MFLGHTYFVMKCLRNRKFIQIISLEKIEKKRNTSLKDKVCAWCFFPSFPLTVTERVFSTMSSPCKLCSLLTRDHAIQCKRQPEDCIPQILHFPWKATLALSMFPFSKALPFQLLTASISSAVEIEASSWGCSCLFRWS